MANFVNGKGEIEQTSTISSVILSRKEKRKALKKLKRKQTRTESAIREREEEEARLNDQEEQLLLRLREQLEAEQAERDRREFEERERVWLEEAAARKAREEEDEQLKKLQEEKEKKFERAYGLEDDDEFEFIEEGPPEIIWQGNEIIIKKRRVKVAKRIAERVPDKKDDDMPTSNPLPPQSVAFAACAQGEPVNVQGVLDRVAQQFPNFGTEQDKAHCPFHLKTGVCRFGTRCSRVHFYPDKSCTLLVKNMYNGPGLICEQDEGLEVCQLMLVVFDIRNTCQDEEVERCYEEFYEDVHTEFLKFGEIINFKIVCEFAGVTKWKVAICGEFMKSRLKTCSHGSACNFIHCFHNPGGDYEWANWDNPPPRFWIKKMVVLFGASVESSYEKDLESDDYYRHREPKRMGRSRSYSHQTEMFHYNEMDLNYGSSDEDELNSKNQYIRQSIMREHSSKSRGHRVSANKNEQLTRNHNSEEHVHSRSFCFHSDKANEGLFEKHRRDDSNMPQNCIRHERKRKNEDKSSSRRKREVYSEVLVNSESEDKSSRRRKKKIYSESESEDRLSSRSKRKVYLEELDNSESQDRSSSRRKLRVYSEEQENSEIQDRSSSRRKRKVYSEEQDNSECKGTTKSHKKHNKKHDPSDRHLSSSDHVDSFSKHSFGSQNQFDGKYSSEDLDTEKDVLL